MTGTLIWYYCVCKREVWLLAHGIEADQEHELIELGRIISESSYKRDKKEIEVDNVKADLMRKVDGQIIIGEVKTFTNCAKVVPPITRIIFLAKLLFTILFFHFLNK